jgi:hypothetical protein
MKTKNNIYEVKLVYRTKVKASDRPQIKSARSHSFLSGATRPICLSINIYS